MKAKVETEQAAALEAQKEQAKKERLLREQKLYNEQDFIRFYYSVYAPLLKLKQAHFQTMAKLTEAQMEEREAALKQLAEETESILQAVEKDLALAGSPLLAQAKSHFEESLRSYLDGIDEALSDQNSNALNPDGLASRLNLFTNNWLKAQGYLYKAIAMWESVYVNKQALPKELPQTVSVALWKDYPFHYRTYVAAEYLAQMKVYDSFNPEDLTARLDLLFRSQEAATLGIKDVPSAIRLLEATDAVRSGDFKQLHPKLYAGLKAPEIPMYRE
ncbi:hypothetical protein [Brevibacillus sp. H7]|uniref:hypothetical protein n=1 Tax=Brevibacillus sp. H7 TaxID=3349138 RepID=UPI0038163356